jgi:hypothetical protein
VREIDVSDELTHDRTEWKRNAYADPTPNKFGQKKEVEKSRMYHCRHFFVLSNLNIK